MVYFFANIGFWVSLLSLFWHCSIQGYSLKAAGYYKIIYPIVILPGLIFFLAKYKFLRPIWLRENLLIKILHLAKIIFGLGGLMFACMLLTNLMLQDTNATALFNEFISFVSFFGCAIIMKKFIIPTAKLNQIQKRINKSKPPLFHF